MAAILHPYLCALMHTGSAAATSTENNDVQSQPDSTSDTRTAVPQAKTITPAPVPKTYIRMPKRCRPPNPLPENYVRLDEITDDLYDLFCKEVLDENRQLCSPLERKLLDNMCASGDFGAAVDYYDEILGELPVVMVHMRTSKVFLSPSLRDQCIEKVIAAKKFYSNPICAALSHIQQLFVGFPPEIRLRHLLLAELEKQEPGILSEDEKRQLALPQSAKSVSRTAKSLQQSSSDDVAGESNLRRTSRTPKPKEMTSVDSKGDIINMNATLTPSSSLSTKFLPRPKPVCLNMLVPLDDDIYDKIADVMAGRCVLETVEDEMLRSAIESLIDSGEVMVEEWTEEQFFCPAGLRLRTNDDVGRLYLRKSEVPEVWRMCYATLSERSQTDILNAVDAQYVGIATKSHLREVSKYDLLKGGRVVFPTPPRCVGRKPMQYVQIDIIAMEETVYGDRSYSRALVVTDLYSGYCFARALTSCAELAFIVRHVMDIFGSFGPPEVYRTFTVDYSSIIADVMMDIERLFKVPIKSMGTANNLTRDFLRILYRRAESDLMTTNRWVEALPFAVMEQNQRPSKFFDASRTPFEIMFGRHAWKDELCPPWVSGACTEEFQMEQQMKSLKKGVKHYVDDVEDCNVAPLESVSDLKMYANSLVESRKRIKTQVLPLYLPVYDEQGKLANPGTGYLYQLYDRIYVRNPQFNSDSRSSKQRSLVARYFRGIIIDIDIELVDSMYKVLYWEDDPHDIDAMSPSQWPAADDRRPPENYIIERPNPYKALENFGTLQSQINSIIRRMVHFLDNYALYCTDNGLARRRTIDVRCRCNDPACTGFAHVRCDRKYSTECCLNSPYYCSYHKGSRLHGEADRSSSNSSPLLPSYRQKVKSPGAVSSDFPSETDTASQSFLSHKRAKYSTESTPPLDKNYAFRNGVLVEISSVESETPSRRGAPPVIRKRGLSELNESNLLPPLPGRGDWSMSHSSGERSNSVATTSDEGDRVQYNGAEQEPQHSATPSPTPSACYEVEISPDDGSQAEYCTPMEDASTSGESSPHLRDQKKDCEVKGEWSEMSLRPRIIPCRDHPYERTINADEDATPTLPPAVNSLLQKFGMCPLPERQGYVASQASTESHARETSHGTKTYRLADAPRTSSHIHPFDAELIEEEQSTSASKDSEQNSQETVSSAVTSTTSPRRVYVIKPVVPHTMDRTERNPNSPEV